jgi:hypothetical protein
MLGTGSYCSVKDFGVTGVEPLDCVTGELLIFWFLKYVLRMGDEWKWLRIISCGLL